ncbi:phenylalanyl-tRNA synthetase, beta subunit [Staphylothermus hellenicus DSM 12710]|uniref:phenylalanine--tRNA ligase n=1 Tax=Staphylothermus hellenicus (strain DSM 12710 / JCM 10830 / BK20S6-10-b1 / P8) TaxID=591019 RepID=D7DBZ8_STAHD|nr:phenylalanyl-tRNA synthetase, beta subunit [Staphylothermus hellenicus DSM 12710]
MPVIRIAKWDLERLVGRTLSNEEIMDYLPRIKCEVETISEDGEIEYEATHDRPDLYSVEGVARSLRYLLGIKSLNYKFIDEGVKAYNMGVPRRPYAAFAIVKDLELDHESVKQIMQLQEKLATTYGRSRRKASIGVYDLDKFKMPIYYELRDPDNTSLVPLNEAREMSLREILEETEKGKIYGHILRDWDKYPVIRSSDGKILSLAPIINSEDTRVTTYTKNVLIDSTGLDPRTVVDAVTIMATSIAERSTSKKIIFVDTIMPDNTILQAPRDKGPTIELHLDDAEKVLGIKIDTKNIVEYLEKMGHETVEISNNNIKIVAPPYRIDIKSWIDIVEDIAMAIGYDTIGVKADKLPPATHPGRMHSLEYISRLIRKILVGYGFTEITSYMMSNPQTQLEMFGLKDKKIITVLNPKMDKYTGLRRWLTPGLLEVIIENKEKQSSMKIFEIGDVAIPDPNTETGARIERRIGIAITHGKATLTDGLAIVSTLLNRLKLNPTFEKTHIKGMLPERTASIKINGEEIGFVAEIHPDILYRLDYQFPVVVSEIVLNKLLIILRQ